MATPGPTAGALLRSTRGSTQPPAVASRASLNSRAPGAARQTDDAGPGTANATDTRQFEGCVELPLGNRTMEAYRSAPPGRDSLPTGDASAHHDLRPRQSAYA